MDRAGVPRSLRPSYLVVASCRKRLPDGYVGSASIAVASEQNCEDQELFMTPHILATSQSRRAPPGISCRERMTLHQSDRIPPVRDLHPAADNSPRQLRLSNTGGSMKRHTICSAVLGLVLAAPAFAGGINLSGSHYNLTLTGVENP